MRRSVRCLRGSLGLCLVLGGVPSAWSVADPGASPADLPPLIVSGERTGPGLWQVSGGGARLWILGTVSPLPVGMTWRAREVTQVLGAVDSVILAKPVELSVPRAFWMLIAQRDLLLLPHGEKLRDVLPPDLYARFAAQRAQFGESRDQWERYRPIIAGALLEERALAVRGLSDRLDVSLAVRRLAREKHVSITELQTPGASDLLRGLRSLPAAAERACFTTLVETVETGVPALAARADAWAGGDVARLRALPPSSMTACATTLDGEGAAVTPWRRTEDAWLTALEARLQGAGAVLAVIDLDMLLGAHGLLQDLSDFGYRVQEP
jgi:uncharacterized protein YbaP (TraB family)